MPRYRLLTYAFAALCALASTSCSSSKKVTRSVPRHTQEIVFRPQKPQKLSSDAAGQNKMSELVSEAHKWLGTKYVYGGHSLSGTDCSGMIMELYLKVFDIKLPRSCREQQKFCTGIDRDKLQWGDLLFFSSSKSSRSVSHVGLYIGNDEMIHASSSRGVIISNITDRYYTSTYHSSGRVPSIEYLGDTPRQPRTMPQQTDDIPEISLDELINTKIDSILAAPQRY